MIRTGLTKNYEMEIVEALKAALENFSFDTIAQLMKEDHGWLGKADKLNHVYYSKVVKVYNKYF